MFGRIVHRLIFVYVLYGLVLFMSAPPGVGQEVMAGKERSDRGTRFPVVRQRVRLARIIAFQEQCPALFLRCISSQAFGKINSFSCAMPGSMTGTWLRDVTSRARFSPSRAPLCHVFPVNLPRRSCNTISHSSLAIRRCFTRTFCRPGDASEQSGSRGGCGGAVRRRSGVL